MKRKNFTLLIFLSAAILMTSCSNNGAKPISNIVGVYNGTAKSAGATKTCSVTITSENNPVTGTYSLMFGSVTEKGKASGSILGAILMLTLKPDNTGVIYKLDGTMADDNSGITGTLTGTENNVAATYTIDLKKN